MAFVLDKMLDYCKSSKVLGVSSYVSAYGLVAAFFNIESYKTKRPIYFTSCVDSCREVLLFK